METESVTLTLPTELLRKVEALAAARECTLSEIVTDLLTEYVRDAEEYAAAREESIESMKQGLPLNTYGKATWTRDELHERR